MASSTEDLLSVRYLMEPQQAKLLATIKTHAAVLARRDYAWIRLLRDTGMRITEFSLMTLRDAQFAIETGWIYIPAARRKGSKGKRWDHRIPVTEPVRESLATLAAINREMGGEGDPATPLVLSRKHARLSVRAYQERLAHWCRVAGIEHASPHWLRYTRAVNVYRRSEARDPARVVQALLGHRSLVTTMRYLRLTKEELLAAVEQVDGRRRPRGNQVARAYAQRVGA